MLGNMGIEAKLTWRKFSNPIHVHDFYPSSATVVGGYIYVMKHSSSKDNIFIFSVATQTWTTFWRFKMRYFHAPVLVNDKLYCIGGNTVGGESRAIGVIDLVVGTERTVDHNIHPLSNHSATYVEKQEEIVIYGNQSSEVFGFNVNSESWIEYRIKGSYKPTIACASQQATVVSNGDIYVFGSVDVLSPETMHILRLGDLHTATWEPVGFGIGKRIGMDLVGICALKDLIVLFGGSNGTGNDVNIFDILTGEGEHLNATEHGTCAVTGAWPSDRLVHIYPVVISRTVWLLGPGNTEILSLEIDR